jgi:hypothetical protein
MDYYKFFKVDYDKKKLIKIHFLLAKTYQLTQKFIYLHKLNNKSNPNRS